MSVERPKHHEVSTAWSGLTVGDLVSIEGEGTFKFKEHVRNMRTGSEWVTVTNNTGVRSFLPSRLKQVGASQAEDPFAAAVTQARKKLGLSRQVVADQCAMTYTDVRRIELGGKRKPGEEQKLLDFFEKLKVSVRIVVQQATDTLE